MYDIHSELDRIKNTCFFDKMGNDDLYQDNILFVSNVKCAFINFSNTVFADCYNDVTWLPSSPSEHDPFYGKRQSTSELFTQRKKINQAILVATRHMDKASFICSPHDFSEAARKAICFAFRQRVTEKYFQLGDHWEQICEIYYSGHWPVATLKGKYIVI